MSETVQDIRLQRALERGFIPQDATEVQIRAGLEDMHEAPLSVLGQYALLDTIEATSQAS